MFEGEVGVLALVSVIITLTIALFSYIYTANLVQMYSSLLHLLRTSICHAFLLLELFQ